MAGSFNVFLRRHAQVLEQGVQAWNQWRKDHPKEEPLLINVRLPEDLAGADLSWANMEHANLNHRDLTEANLEHARLHSASLLDADMAGAKLRGATLTATHINGALR